MLVRTVFQNLDMGGGERWDILAERIDGAFDGAPADLVLLCECKGWGDDDPTMLSRAASDLGMTALPLPPSRTGMPPAILYREESMGKPVEVNDDFSGDYIAHGVMTACWDVGLPHPLGAAVTHLSPFSSGAAVIEAEYVGFTARRYQPFVLIGGDFNYPPLFSPPGQPDPSRMSILNIARRYKDPLVTPPRVRNTDVAQQLADDHFHDAFELLHGRTRDPQFTAPTGKTDRIDWIMVTDALVPAVASGRLLDTPEGASDHHGVAVTIDTALIDTSLAE